MGSLMSGLRRLKQYARYCARTGREYGATRAREAFRHGVVRPTCGIARGFAQANMIALPREYAFDFLLFTQRNPKPCPIHEVLDPGNPKPSIAAGSDIHGYSAVPRVGTRQAGGRATTSPISGHSMTIWSPS